MILSHKIALMPNNKQRTYFQKAAGTAGFAYNWGLSEWSRLYREHKENPAVSAPSEGLLRRQLNSIKREQFPWMLEVTKNAPQMTIMQLGQAFTNFFTGRAKYPVFHKKGLHDSFTVTNDQFRIENKKIRIPQLGWVRMCESPRFEEKSCLLPLDM